MKNKLTKLLTLLLSLLAITCFSFACAPSEGENNDPPKHAHEYSTEYEYDETNHWFECECGEKSKIKEHTLTDGKCVCGYEKEEEGGTAEHTHDFTITKYDETNHWKECVCGEKSEVTSHNFANNKCECGKYESSYYTEGLVFELVDDEYSVTDYKGSASEVIIPYVYKSKPVTSIGYYAFYNRMSLTSVEIGDSVTSICDGAFDNCNSLTSVEIGDSVTSIGDSAFMGCDSLTSVVIGGSVTSIGSYAFSWCSSLTSIEVSENNANYKSIDGNLYTKDGKTLVQYAIGKTATSFTIPNSVTSIGEAAFCDCDSLTSIVIGDSVESIGDRAFEDCNSLTSVEIPSSVISIGYGAFEYCSSLTSIEVSENNANYKSINGNLYSKDEKTLIQYAIGKTATSFTIPNSVESIGDHAFRSCDSLTSVEIGDSVTSICDGAFAYCDSLTSVEIGDSVTSIGESAFAYCDSLTSVEIGDSVTSIGESAFRSCDSLTSVEIPSSVISIGWGAFSQCDSLTSIKYRGTEAQWSAITKGSYWDSNTGSYTITYNYDGE